MLEKLINNNTTGGVEYVRHLSFAKTRRQARGRTDGRRRTTYATTRAPLGCGHRWSTGRAAPARPGCGRSTRRDGQSRRSRECVQWPRRRARDRSDRDGTPAGPGERARFMWSIAMSVSFPFQLQPDPERERTSWRSMHRPKAQHGLLLHLHRIAMPPRQIKCRSAAGI